MDMHPEQDHACGDVLRLEDQEPVTIKDPFHLGKNPNEINHVERIQMQ